MSESPKSKFVYVADPMCSWCWGFAPTLAKIRSEFGDQFSFNILMGGLRPGPLAQPLDSRLRPYLRSAWEKVHSQTGQPFDFDFLDREHFLYDSEPPCQAVVAVRRLFPEAVFDYYDAVQKGFYAEKMDPTDPSVLKAHAVGLGLDGDAFEEAYQSAGLKDETELDFESARRMGATGFPTTFVHDDDGWHLISQGWFSPDKIDQAFFSLEVTLAP